MDSACASPPPFKARQGRPPAPGGMPAGPPVSLDDSSASARGACAKSSAVLGVSAPPAPYQGAPSAPPASSSAPRPVPGGLAKSSAVLGGPVPSAVPSGAAPSASSSAPAPAPSSAPLPPWKVNKQPELPKPSLGSKAAPSLPKPPPAAPGQRESQTMPSSAAWQSSTLDGKASMSNTFPPQHPLPVKSGPSGVLIPPPMDWMQSRSPPVKPPPAGYPTKASSSAGCGEKGAPGFSKAGLPPATVPPISSAALDILRQGEELLRQTALLQQREELVKLREEEERKKQEEERRIKEEIERRRQEEEKRKQEELERIRLQMEQARKEAEEKRRLKEEAERKEREHADLQAQVLQSELVKLVEVAEEQVQFAVEQAATLESPETSVEDVVLLGDSYDGTAQSATSAVRACFFFMEGKHVKLKGNAEPTMAACASLLKKIHAAKAKCETTIARVKRRAKDAQEEITARTLQVELESLLIVAETEAEGVNELQSKADEALASAKAEASSGSKTGGGESDRNLVRVLTELEKPGAAASEALKRCMALLDRDLVRMRGPTEELQAACAKLNVRTRKLKSNVDEVLAKAKSAKATASQRIEREDRRQAARDEALRQDSIFKKYDEDGDGFLCKEEIQAYVLGEYGFALTEEKLKPMLNSASDGVPLSDFARLRSQVGVAYSEVLGKQRKDRNDRQLAAIRKDVVETTSAIAGVEAEVAKAEMQVRHLNPLLSRAAQDLDALTQKTEEAEAAVSAAEDFLAAAKEQAQRLGRAAGPDELEREAKAIASQEAKRLEIRIGTLERRLVGAASVTKNARGKIELAEKKAALLRQAESM
eukprot:TRINITY_DN4980_c0_g2_i1.p1 TRINITY_DN4980_c0_g2~~TRINITY_DN4980_c0_g2_i1.p1  ORF type:complete len:890 (+),score=231.07 TRINITY_DN4980_c0_g2_i1:195-2672(+)